MAKNIYNYDISESTTPVVRVSNVKLGTGDSSYANNSLATGKLTSIVDSDDEENGIVTPSSKISYNSYGYTDTQVPLVSAQAQYAEGQEEVDKGQDNRLKYMEAYMGTPSGSTSGGTGVSGHSQAEQEIIDNGGVANIAVQNRSDIVIVKDILKEGGITMSGITFDAGSW